LDSCSDSSSDSASDSFFQYRILTGNIHATHYHLPIQLARAPASDVASPLARVVTCDLFVHQPLPYTLLDRFDGPFGILLHENRHKSTSSSPLSEPIDLGLTNG
jgi:hypothetical protein